MSRRRALLVAALGFLKLREQPAEVVMFRHWLDSWAGMGDVIAGLTRQGLDAELCQFPNGWRANLYPTGTATPSSLRLGGSPRHGARCNRRGGER